MAVKIRMKRFGTKNSPKWRIVVSDAKMPRDGRFIEEIGYHHHHLILSYYQNQLDLIYYY